MPSYLSIVIPTYNEAENIPLLYSAINSALKEYPKTYELLFVDDGSTDNTHKVLKQLKTKSPDIKVLKHKQNKGQTLALSTGIKAAQGEIIITFDGDLQYDPKDIILFAEKIEDGFDVVNAWRRDRQDNFFTKRLPSKVANYLIGLTCGLKLRDHGSGFKAFKRKYIKNISLKNNQHRYLSLLAKLNGANNIVEVCVSCAERPFGKSKYTILRFFPVLKDLISFIFFRLTNIYRLNNTANNSF
ncbi:glycosyltransferase family 2 protein [Candidatus Margulisiibacteriota bacterium]